MSLVTIALFYFFESDVKIAYKLKNGLDFVE